MYKIIILTFLLLVLSLLSDLFVKNSNKGMFMNNSFAKINKKNTLNSLKYDLKVFDTFKFINEIDERIVYKNIRGTVYHAIKNQTDSTPLLTADMSLIDPSRVNDLRWVALSRDLLKRSFIDKNGNRQTWTGKIKLGDTIWVDYDKKELWRLSYQNKEKFEKLKIKYEKIRGFWVVHDVMSNKYLRKEKDGTKTVVELNNTIDFLQDPKDGFLDAWKSCLTISKKRVEYLTLEDVVINKYIK